MSYQFGKAVAGGTPLDERELNAAETARLEAMYARLQQPALTDDPLDQRLAEELDYAQRLLGSVELELKQRGPALIHLARFVAEAKTVVGDVGRVVVARDRCDGVAQASADLRRRLTRDTSADDAPICARDRGRIRRRPVEDI